MQLSRRSPRRRWKRYKTRKQFGIISVGLYRILPIRSYGLPPMKKSPVQCKFPPCISLFKVSGASPTYGSMAELAYAAVSKTAAGNGLRVRFPLLLPQQYRILTAEDAVLLCLILYRSFPLRLERHPSYDKAYPPNNRYRLEYVNK